MSELVVPVSCNARVQSAPLPTSFSFNPAVSLPPPPPLLGRRSAPLPGARSCYSHACNALSDQSAVPSLSRLHPFREPAHVCARRPS
eukprot:scaffold21440_cov146-Isochrysis_galbana.AAC.1